MVVLLVSKSSCCGCSACMSSCPENAISMEPDAEGFLYPVIDDGMCLDCGICSVVCAFQSNYPSPIVRKEPTVFAVKHRSDVVRQNSSSGGAFTAISDLVLDFGGIVYGAAFTDDFHVHHKAASNKIERDEFRGSKYVQSNTTLVFPEIQALLNNEKMVLFSGTPCQVAGLNSYLSHSHTLTEHLLTVDVICHGTPSPKVFTDYISLIELIHHSAVSKFNFRSKVNGWGFTQQIFFSDSTEDHVSKLSQAFKELFLSNICLCPACHNCKYTNFFRPSDITISDFKGIAEIYPDFTDSLGVSAMMINTDKGNDVYLHIEKDLVCLPTNIHELASKQLNLKEPTPPNSQREIFWGDFFQNGISYVMEKYSSWRPEKIN